MHLQFNESLSQSSPFCRFVSVCLSIAAAVAARSKILKSTPLADLKLQI
ncbi:unnamed protein product [Rhodiola kirilowii]